MSEMIGVNLVFIISHCRHPVAIGWNRCLGFLDNSIARAVCGLLLSSMSTINTTKLYYYPRPRGRRIQYVVGLFVCVCLLP